MKRKALSLLLTLAMLLSLVPAFSVGAAAEETTYYVSTSGNDSNAGTESAPFLTIGAALTAAGNSEATIKLLSDIQESITVESSQKITLDLNDCKFSATDMNRAILNQGTLYITDSDTSPTTRYFIKAENGPYNCVLDQPEETVNYVAVEGGCIAQCSAYNKHGGGVYNDSGATLYLQGGNIAANRALNSKAGGGVYNADGATFYMEGGSITANFATGYPGGGGVCNVSGAAFYMTGGTIVKNDTYNEGGGVYNAGTMTMQGGSIAENNTSYSGGGIYNNGGTVTMVGGEITDNTNGGLWNYDGTLVFGGTAKVKGNSGYGVTPSNVYLYEYTDGVSISAETPPVTTGDNKMDIGILAYDDTYDSMLPFTITSAGDYSACFTGDYPNQQVEYVSTGTPHLEIAKVEGYPYQWYLEFDWNTGVYILNSTEQLKEFANLVNGTADVYGTGYYVQDDFYDDEYNNCPMTVALSDNFRSTGALDTVIGYDISHCFKGTFDGNAKNIALNLSYCAEGDTSAAVALFGFNSGIIQNVSVSGSVTAEYASANEDYGAYAGGIVAYNMSPDGTVFNCSSTAEVTAKLTNANATKANLNFAFAGGIAGYSNGPVLNCYAVGEATCAAENGAEGNTTAGSIVGYCGSTSPAFVESCYYLAGNDTVGVGNYDDVESQVFNCVALPESQIKAPAGTAPEADWVEIDLLPDSKLPCWQMTEEETLEYFYQNYYLNNSYNYYEMPLYNGGADSKVAMVDVLNSYSMFVDSFISWCSNYSSYGWFDNIHFESNYNYLAMWGAMPELSSNASSTTKAAYNNGFPKQYGFNYNTYVTNILSGGKAYSSYYDGELDWEKQLPEGLSYDETHGCYVMENYVYDRFNPYDDAFRLVEDTTIALKGENLIGIITERDAMDTYNQLYSAFDVIEDVPLTFTGDGNLTIYCYDDAFCTHNLTFDKGFTGKVTVIKNGVDGEDCCIDADDGGTVSIKNGTFNFYSVDYDTIDAAKVVISGGTVNLYAEGVGICADTVTISGGTTNIYADTYGIGCDTLTLMGGVTAIEAEEDGVHANNLIGLGGTLKANGGAESAGIGMYSGNNGDYNAIIASGKITAKGGYCGIWVGTEEDASASLKVISGEVYAVGTDASHGCGICVGNKNGTAALKIEGGTVSGTGTVYGIAADAATVSGGTVTAIASTANAFETNQLRITGGELKAKTGAEAAFSGTTLLSVATTMEVSGNDTSTSTANKLYNKSGTEYVTIKAKQEETSPTVISGGTSSGVSSYSISAAATTHGSVSAGVSTAQPGSTVTLTVKADTGWTMKTLSVKNTKGEEVPVLAKQAGESYVFTMPASAVTVSATFQEVKGNVFIDVYASDYYYDAVKWAATNGITSGVDATHFAPMDITTRGQMVTFLWRAAGSPETTATTTAFTDVEANQFYYKAVLWAVEKGITNGMTATSFDPYGTVTRGQTVTFLARYEGVKDNATGYTHSFTDVKEADYYNNAVAWAATNGITTGATTTTFAPDNSCLRGEIVTFLYRDIVK